MNRAQPRWIAGFDSTSGMVRALSRFLHGRDFPGMGMLPSSLEPVGLALNRLPRGAKEFIYAWSGWAEAARASQLKHINVEEISRWVCDSYPRRKYPAVFVGSSGGAMIHLCAALGVPWLPQTFLIPVRRHGIDEDDPQADMHRAEGPGWDLLHANPQIQLHHMHDANQDRLMIRHMTYFRYKRLWLGRAYEEFLKERLAPGGTIYLNECELSWPTVKIRDRHYFQHGALGGATVDEFQHGGARVAEYLERYGSDRRRWEAPAPEGESPEAEWGFEPALREDVERFARGRGYRVRRIVHQEPEHLSPLVADLHRWWYRRRRLAANRLVADCFLLTEPFWTLRTASTPYWMTFNKEPSADALEEYLDHTEPFDEIYLTLFSHGVDSVGLTPVERWRAILSRARWRGEFLGVDERQYPRDFAVYVRHHLEFKRKIPARYPLPGPLTFGQLETFLAESSEKYAVQWFEGERIFGPADPATALPTVSGKT